MEITRLFDILDLYKERTKELNIALAHKVEGNWVYYSAQDYVDIVNNISYAFLELGVQKGDKIAVISGNRPEWNFLDMAIQQVGAVTMPIYPTISKSDYQFILHSSEVQYVFVEGASLLQKIEEILPNVPSLKGIYTFIDRGKYKYFMELVEIGKANPRPEVIEKIKSEIKPDNIATLLYTSGTTGTPKGVMLSHKNIVSNFLAIKDIPPVKVGDRALSFLPLCHIYERMLNYCWQYLGLEIYYCDAASVGNYAKEIKPHAMCCVPRILEKIYDKMYVAGEKLPFFKKKIYYWALDIAMLYELDNKKGYIYGLKIKLADILVYRKLRENIGGNFSVVISGGAALQPRLNRFFTAIGVPLLEGYGMTETSPVIAVSHFGKNGVKFGTVGPPLKEVQVKISDDGEILCKGPGVMLGYLNDPESTAAMFTEDGWLRTGDTGVIEPEGQLKITGRKKSLFKTSFGKYVNPEIIESKFKESPFIDNIIVMGEGQKFAAALIVADLGFLKEWWKRKKLGVYPSKEDIVENSVVKARFMKELDKYNKCFGEAEKVKKIIILADEWSPDSGDLTQTLKLRRKIIEAKYAKEIEKLFS